MKVNTTDSFLDSLERLSMHQTWWYRAYEVVRYDVPRFFKNIWKFRKALWNHRWWDHHALLQFMEIGLDDMSDKIELHGIEIDEMRLKKVDKMRRVAQLIRNYNEDNYVEQAEAELGEIVRYDWEFEEVPGRTYDNPLGEKDEKLYRLVEKETSEEKAHNRKVYNRAKEIQNAEWDELFTLLKGQDYSTFSNDIDFYSQCDGSGLRTWWD